MNCLNILASFLTMPVTIRGQHDVGVVGVLPRVPEGGVRRDLGRGRPGDGLADAVAVVPGDVAEQFVEHLEDVRKSRSSSGSGTCPLPPVESGSILESSSGSMICWTARFATR